MSLPADDDKPRGIFKLPPELRAEIHAFLYPRYHHVKLTMIDESTTIRTHGIWKNSKLNPSLAAWNMTAQQANGGQESIPKLYKTCRLLYHEALPVMYNSTVFHLAIKDCTRITFDGKEICCVCCSGRKEHEVPSSSSLFCRSCADRRALRVRNCGRLGLAIPLHRVRHIDLRLPLIDGRWCSTSYYDGSWAVTRAHEVRAALVVVARAFAGARIAPARDDLITLGSFAMTVQYGRWGGILTPMHTLDILSMALEMDMPFGIEPDGWLRDLFAACVAGTRKKLREWNQSGWDVNDGLTVSAVIEWSGRKGQGVFVPHTYWVT